MVLEQRHEMRLELIHPTGVEEWLCPTCGRRFIAQWEPKYRRLILEEGQNEIVHVGQAMDLLLQDVNGSTDDPLNDVPNLQDVWKRWIDSLNLDDDAEEGSS